MSERQCVYVADEGRCPDDHEDLVLGLGLCWFHRGVVRRDFSLSVLDQLAAEYAEDPNLPHSPGATYILRLPNGNIKIGYTRGDGGLARALQSRWSSLSRDFGGRVYPLAVVRGGVTMEMFLHWKFDEFRLVGLPKEQFQASGDLELFAMTAGMIPEAREAIERFVRWKPQKDLSEYQVVA